MDEVTSKTSERSTEVLYLRVRPEAKIKANEDAQQYGLAVNEYVTALILGQDPVPKLAVEIGSLAILGARVVAALDALPPDATGARDAISDLRKALVDVMLAHRAEYDARLDKRGVEGSWD